MLNNEAYQTMEGEECSNLACDNTPQGPTLDPVSADILQQTLGKYIAYPSVNVKEESSPEDSSPKERELNPSRKKDGDFQKRSCYASQKPLLPDVVYLSFESNSSQQAEKEYRHGRENNSRITSSTNWNSCFKNNYLFARNSRGECVDEESPWYRNYDIFNSKLKENTDDKKANTDCANISESLVLITDKFSTTTKKIEGAVAISSRKIVMNEDRKEKKGPVSWFKKLKTPRKEMNRCPTENDISSTDEGPRTSTPKEPSVINKVDATPRRNPSERRSVRRRLCLSQMKGIKRFEGSTFGGSEELLGRNSISADSFENSCHKSTSLPEMRLSNTLDIHRKNSGRKARTAHSFQKPKKCLIELEENLLLAPNIRSESAVVTSESSKDAAPVESWLREIRTLTENECLSALQAKHVAKNNPSLVGVIAVGNAQEDAERIWEESKCLLDNLQFCINLLAKKKASRFAFCIEARYLCSRLHIFFEKWRRASNKEIRRARCLLSDISESKNEQQFQEQEWRDKTVAELNSLSQILPHLIEQMILDRLMVIFNTFKETSDFCCMKRAVFAVILLGRLGETFCCLLTKAGVVQALLSVCVEKKWQLLHSSALRALTVICCVFEAVQNLQKSGGVEIIAELLCEEEMGLSEMKKIRCEAAGLIAQITAPWTEGSNAILHSIRCLGSQLVQSLTELISTTNCSEEFLLAMAALANLSFANTQWMKEHRTVRIIVEACRSKSRAVARSFFIRDQVATVLANVAADELCREEMLEGGGLVLLLCLLQLRPSVGHNVLQRAACERIQQKSAIALARLCVDPAVADIVAQMQGTQRLIKLCKDSKERNNSDSVLVACLAALRKISAAIGNTERNVLGATELLRPSLWEAYLANVSKRESYV